MLKKIINKEYLLQLFPNEKDYIKSFFELQLADWEFAKNNYSELKKVRLKKYVFDETKIFVQHNPQRAISTFADTSEKAVRKRKCFLCNENLFDKQIGLTINSNFTLLVNPYPIVSPHFTAKFNNHLPQRINENFTDFISVSEFLGEDYFTLYNGPEAGASVPEHRHFQAGNASSLPIIAEIKSFLNNRNRRIIKIHKENRIGSIKSFLASDILRAFILIIGEKSEEITEMFFKVFENLQVHFPSELETKINLLLFFYGANKILVIFPRKKHRPDFYYSKTNPIKISPATIDISGLLVAPRSSDFQSITTDNIKEIYNEVIFDYNELSPVLNFRN